MRPEKGNPFSQSLPVCTGHYREYLPTRHIKLEDITVLWDVEDVASDNIENGKIFKTKFMYIYHYKRGFATYKNTDFY